MALVERKDLWRRRRGHIATKALEQSIRERGLPQPFDFERQERNLFRRIETA
jgi:hypothetical protein